MTNSKPVQKYKAGGVEAAVWTNEVVGRDGSAGTMHSVSLERRYKDERGNWKSTSSFRESDVPKALLVLRKAYEYVALDTDGGDVI